MNFTQTHLSNSIKTLSTNYLGNSSKTGFNFSVSACSISARNAAFSHSTNDQKIAMVCCINYLYQQILTSIITFTNLIFRCDFILIPVTGRSIYHRSMNYTKNEYFQDYLEWYSAMLLSLVSSRHYCSKPSLSSNWYSAVSARQYETLHYSIAHNRLVAVRQFQH